MPAHGLGEDAFGVMGMNLLRTIDVREAEHLAAEGVADETRDVGVYVVPVAADRERSASALVFPGGADLCGTDLGGEGRRGGSIAELEEEEAVAARGADHAGQDAHALGVGVDAGQGVDVVAGDEELGEARGLRELEGRAARRRVDQPRTLDDRPLRARGGRGEAAAEAGAYTGDEGAAEREPHFGPMRGDRRWGRPGGRRRGFWGGLCWRGRRVGAGGAETRRVGWDGKAVHGVL